MEGSQIIDLGIFDQIIELTSAEKNHVVTRLKFAQTPQKKQSALEDGLQEIYQFIYHIISTNDNLKHLINQPQSMMQENQQEEEVNDFMNNPQNQIRRTINALEQQNKPNQPELDLNISKNIQDLFNLTQKEIKDQSQVNIDYFQKLLINHADQQKNIQKVSELIQTQIMLQQDSIQDVRNDIKTGMMLQMPYAANINQQQRKPCQLSKHVVQIDISSLMPGRPIIQNINTKVLKKVELVNSYKDKGSYFKVVHMLKSGKIIAGGIDKKIQIFSSSFQLLQTQELSGDLSAILEVGNQIYCGQWSDSKISIIDSQTLKTVSQITCQGSIKRMIKMSDEYLLVGQGTGYLNVVSVSQPASVFEGQHFLMDQIQDIVKTQRQNEYAVAFKAKGMAFIELKEAKKNQFQYSQNLEEHYFKDKQVLSIYPIENDLLIVCVDKVKNFQILDRKQKGVIKEIVNDVSSGQYDNIQPIIGYHPQNMPFLICKEYSQVFLVNTLTMTTQTIISASHKYYTLSQIYHQYVDKGTIKVIIVTHKGEDAGERGIVEYALQF